jgi:phosphohistidine phosphatase
MDLFILRHGKAGKSSGGPDDAARELTRKGRDEVEGIARWMREQQFRFDAIASSPLQRALETAAVVASALDQEDILTTWDVLAPGGDTDTVCSAASKLGDDGAVLIVGHEPGLSGLISAIISGDTNSSIVLSKGGLAKIRNYSFRDHPSGELQWLLTPKQILSMR